MLNKLIHTFILGVAFFAMPSVWSQLTTTTGLTPVQLVQNVLVGNGVTVTNVSYTGDLKAIGSFNGTGSNLGLASGIVMTTGTVLPNTGLLGGQQGPHGPNTNGSAGVDNNTAGNTQLTNIAGQTTFNASILEFDFVPNSDSIKFKYVFGSEEYPEFVNAGFNDVFAFFISGPGFGGNYNMATIPGTAGTPVTIDNVNANSNSSYFVDNGDGTSAPQNNSSYYIQYDGFTVVIEAKAKVQCGETYHLKMAIADVGDGAYDSGIFLEANSLKSILPVEISSTLSKNIFNNNTSMAESCESATISITRDASQASQTLSIPLSTGGTAIEGVDYSSVPTSINFNPGQTVVTFNLDVFQDNLLEGDETLKLILDQPDPCGNSNLITLNLLIKEIAPITVSLNDESILCPGDAITLAPTVTGGAQPYFFNWDNGQVSQSISDNPLQTTNYILTLTDDCNADTVTKSVQVFVPTYAPLQVSTFGDTAVLCPRTPVTLLSFTEGGAGSNNYVWSANNQNIGIEEQKLVAPFETINYQIKVTDICNNTDSAILELKVLTTVLKIVPGEDQVICKGEEVEIEVAAFGGLGDFTYYWPHSGETTNKVMVNPLQSKKYYVRVADGCGTYEITGTIEVGISNPNASFNVLSTEPMEGLPTYFKNNSTGAVSYFWDLGNGETSFEYAPNATYSPWGNYQVVLVAASEAGCLDTFARQIYIKPEFYFYAPNVFTPDNDRFNKVYKVSLIGSTAFHFVLYNRWGEIVFESFDPDFSWDGRYAGELVKDDTYVYRCFITDLEGKKTIHDGFVTVLK
ncbi:choice-of-anchor L domain-containing protein [Putridiphycobacter roseus]|nr:choice-of-anchor L domain-containing protein [Putridiphycobacter roseus]